MITDQDHYRISPIEMSILIISMIIGVGILTLPRALTSAQETADGYFSIAFAGLLVCVFVMIYVKLQKNFIGKNLLQFVGEGKVGKWVAQLLSIGFIMYFITLVGFEARMLGIVVKMFLLDQTPTEIIAAISILIAAYAVTKGAQGIVHLSLMFFPIIVGAALLEFPFNVMNVDVERVLPILPEGIMPVIIGVKEIILSYLGIEILLFFMAYMKAENIKAMPLNIGVAFITLLYMLVFFFTVAVFGVDMTMFITFPTVELAKEVEIPGGFIERLESLLITVWIMTIFITMSIGYFLALQTIKQQFLPKKKGTYLSAIIAFFSLIMAFIPMSLSETFELGDNLGWFGFVIIVSSIVCGIVTVWARKRKTQQSAVGGM